MFHLYAYECKEIMILMQIHTDILISLKIKLNKHLELHMLLETKLDF